MMFVACQPFESRFRATWYLICFESGCCGTRKNKKHETLKTLELAEKIRSHGIRNAAGDNTQNVTSSLDTQIDVS